MDWPKATMKYLICLTGKCQDELEKSIDSVGIHFSR
jgi:hypothetical protein